MMDKMPIPPLNLWMLWWELIGRVCILNKNVMRAVTTGYWKLVMFGDEVFFLSFERMQVAGSLWKDNL